ncbi:hypothetical protein M405DRAFT_846179 [Rhizopogon salebrosus TDB-379]|nr:hypothetical protein M405DRAFT_846179 [Rhizopogon salebrosus TDB-379]
MYAAASWAALRHTHTHEATHFKSLGGTNLQEAVAHNHSSASPIEILQGMVGKNLRDRDSGGGGAQPLVSIAHPLTIAGWDKEGGWRLEDTRDLEFARDQEKY